MYIVARAVASTSPEAASVLQRAANRIFPNQPERINELRAATTSILEEAIGEDRLGELQTQGDVMDQDHAVAYALDSIAKALAVMSQ
jgi:hypothetical protein